MTVPAEAIDRAVTAVIAAEIEYSRTRIIDGRGWSMPPRDQIRRLVQAAADVLRTEGAAAERDRIRQIALRVRAIVPNPPSDRGTLFADLLDGTP